MNADEMNEIVRKTLLGEIKAAAEGRRKALEEHDEKLSEGLSFVFVRLELGISVKKWQEAAIKARRRWLTNPKRASKFYIKRAKRLDTPIVIDEVAWHNKNYPQPARVSIVAPMYVGDLNGGG